ncbi:MAG: hypothetical protein CMM15_08000, partial [Rhodospirillaceae bacterium]|nr:hypothetical protein [Rhodospirillaceae bacterium]
KQILDFEKSAKEYNDEYWYWVQVEFTEPDTGEKLIAYFKLCHWYKAPYSIEKDIRERLMNPIQSVAGKVALQDQVQK